MMIGFPPDLRLVLIIPFVYSTKTPPKYRLLASRTLAETQVPSLPPPVRVPARANHYRHPHMRTVVSPDPRKTRWVTDEQSDPIYCTLPILYLYARTTPTVEGLLSVIDEYNPEVLGTYLRKPGCKKLPTDQTPTTYLSKHKTTNDKKVRVEWSLNLYSQLRGSGKCR